MAPRTPKDPAKAPTTRKAAKPKAPDAAGAAPAQDSAAGVAKPAKATKADTGKAKAPAFRLRDLVAQVATTTKAKKPDAKKSVEATLAAMSAALAAGSDLALPPWASCASPAHPATS